MSLTRRRAMQSAAATALAGPLSACAEQSPKTTGKHAVQGGDSLDPFAEKLSEISDQLLTAYPETAALFGVDEGRLSHLKSKLTDRSPEGQARIAEYVRTTLSELRSIEAETLSDADALHLEVVRTAFELTKEGFDFPFGDVPLLNSNWSWRPTPYVVAHNIGAFIEIPSVLDGSHSIESHDDVDAYLERLSAYADQLDGETERLRIDGDAGTILPDFLMSKATGQLKATLETDPNNWGVVTSFLSGALDIDAGTEEKVSSIAK